MFKNYLKTGLRNFKRHKVFSFINIAGLTIGLAASILILVFIQNELSFDRFHKNAKNIYRIVMNQPWNNWMGKSVWAITPGGLSPALKQEYPEVVHASRVSSRITLVKHGEQTFNETGFCYVDPDFLEIFTFSVLSGNAQAALNEPFSVLLTEEMSLKYFGSENPIGQTIRVNNSSDYTVRGIVANPPQNSHLQFNFLSSFTTLYSLRGRENIDVWNSNSYQTYIQLPEGYDPKTLEAKIPALLSRHRDTREGEAFILQPISQIQLGSAQIHDRGRGDKKYVYFLSAIALFIILIACFNYMNLSTARASTRAKEVGLRKVVGADRRKIIKQFMGESVSFSLVSLILALVLVSLFLPTFGSLTQRELTFSLLKQMGMVLPLAALVVLVGLVSGTYPAIYLASFQPSSIIRGQIKKASSGSSRLWNSLVVVQFAVSIALIFCTITVGRQLDYIKNKDLGFEGEQILTLRAQDPNLQKNSEPLKAALNLSPQITDISFSYSLPIMLASNSVYKNPPWAGKGAAESFYVNWGNVDYSFFALYGIDIIKGRNFDIDHPTDKTDACIINETAARVIGWDDPIGKQLDDKGTVIGVVRDFHYRSLHREIEPVCLKLNPKGQFQFVSLKIPGDNLPFTLAFIENTWKRFSPDYPFNFAFLDEQIDILYRSEQRMSRIFSYFSFLAIFISCLGLFGLASFNAERRTREIGIRKVLGATVPSITLLLSRDFSKWVLLANLLAWPVAYLVMKNWLSNFAYRIEVGIGGFILSGALALVIALLTVSYQSIKSAVLNPGDSLRCE